MNTKKLITVLLLSLISVCGIYACQYTTGYIAVPYYNTWSDYYSFQKLSCRRFIYLSGINTPGNHISAVSLSSSGDSVKLVWSATNFVEVSMPLTVYVGIADVYGGAAAYGSYNYYQELPAGKEMKEITLIAQYRIMPETTWRTAAVKKFSSGEIALLSKKKVFGAVQINANVASGSTVLVRLYVAVNRLTHYDVDAENLRFMNVPNDVQLYSTYVENADLDSLTVEKTSDIAATEQHESYVTTTGTATSNGQSYSVTDNWLSSDLHMCGWREAMSSRIPTYLDYWSPQFVMAVRIKAKRRPGND